MTWFVVGVGVGGIAGFLLAWMLQDENEMGAAWSLAEENAALRRQNATLCAQLEALDEFTASGRS